MIVPDAEICFLNAFVTKHIVTLLQYLFSTTTCVAKDFVVHCFGQRYTITACCYYYSIFFAVLQPLLLPLKQQRANYYSHYLHYTKAV